MPSFRIRAVCLIATGLVAALPSMAQPPARSQRSVALGHVDLNSADPDAALAFWTTVIGASVYGREGVKGVGMIGGLILFTRGNPTGPSAGSAIERVAIHVPEIQPFIDRLAKTPYKGTPSADGSQLVIDGPDGVRIELTEDSSMYAPLEFDRVYFASAKPDEMQGWYSKVFGARPGTYDQATSSRLPGGTLTFAKADSASPSAGRGIDHVGFEVKDLEAFCAKLTSDGVKLDSPYRADSATGIASAFLTDPWGVRIELTEGLAR